MYDRPSDAERVDARVLVEALVLSGDDRLLQAARDLRERLVAAVLLGEELREQAAVAVGDDRALISAASCRGVWVG